MKINPPIFWRVVSAVVALGVSLGFYWLAFLKPDYAAALIFVSVVIQLLIYAAYKNQFP